MAQCRIKEKTKELIEAYSKTLKLLGINDNDELESFLSVFLQEEQYNMYLKNKKQSELENNDGRSNTDSNTTDNSIHNIGNTSNENITEKEEDNGKQNETNEDSTTVEDAERENKDGEQITQDEVIKSFKDKVQENRDTFKDYNTAEGLAELNNMTEEEIDALIAQESQIMKSYVSILKDVHTYEKLKKTLGDNGANIYAYVKDTVKSSVFAISRIIENAKKGFDKYSENVLSSSKNEDRAMAKIDEKFSEMNQKTIKPLKEAIKNIEEVKDAIRVLDDNKKTFQLAKVKKTSEALLSNLESGVYRDANGKVIEQIKEETSKISEDMQNSINNIMSVSVKINKLKADAYANRVNFDDYNAEGSKYRELKRELEKEYSKLKTYTEAIGFYFEHRKYGGTFDKFMSTATGKTSKNSDIMYKTSKSGFVNYIDANGKRVYVYNKFAKYFSLSSDQRSFYSVTNLPSYLQSGKSVVINIDEDILTSEDHDILAETKAINYEDKRNELITNGRKFEKALVNMTINVLIAKGKSFQQRHFGGDKASLNIENSLNIMSGPDGKEKDTLIENIKNLYIYKTIEKLNTIDFQYPDLYKSMANYDYLQSNAKGKIDLKNHGVEAIRLDNNGLPYVYRANNSNAEINKIITENSDLSLISLIPGSSDAIGDLNLNSNLNNASMISDDVKNAIKIHTLATIEDIIKMTNIGQNDDQFIDIWGIDKGSFDGDMADIEKLAAEGYLPRSVLIQSLGSAIYNDIGFKFNGNVSTLVSEGIKTQLGLLAIQSMIQSGILEDIDTIENGVKLYNVGSSSNPKNQAMIKLNKESKFQKNEDGKVELKTDKLYIEDLQDISALMNHLYSFDTKKKPSFEKPAPRFDRTVRNGFQKVSQDTNRILNDYESVAHKFNDISKDVYDLWKNDKEDAYNFVGIGHLTDVGSKGNYNGNKHNIENAMAQASKFNNERLELDTLMEFYEDNMFDKVTGEPKNNADVEFYIPWDFTVSGRYMVDSNINPQTGKVATRYLVQSKQMDTEMKTDENGNFDKDEMHQFKVALAQGFGTGIDKSTDDTAFGKMDELFSIDSKGNVKFKESDVLSDAHKGYLFFRKTIESDYKGNGKLEQDFINDIFAIEGFDPEDEEYVGQDIKKVKANLIGKFKEFIGQPVHAGEETHTLTAMRALAEIDMFAKSNSGSKVFNHSLTSEADDITSGMILTLMGLGTSDSRAFLEKGGVYTKEAQEFWQGLIDHLSMIGKDGKNDTGNKQLDSILDSYKGYLTHGFLVEFGKLMDDVDYKQDIESRLANMKEYSQSVIDNRIHFKDFYNTVATQSGRILDSITKKIDSIFNPSEELKSVATVDEIGSIISELRVENPLASKKDISSAVFDRVASSLSSVIDDKGYSTLNTYVAASKFVIDRVFGDKTIPAYEKDTKYTFEFIKNSLLPNIATVSKQVSEATKVGEENKALLLQSLEMLELDMNDKFDRDKNKSYDGSSFSMNLAIREFLRNNNVKVAFNKDKYNSENYAYAVSALNEYMVNNIKDKESYDSFIKSFRPIVIDKFSRSIFNKNIAIVKEDDSFHKVANVVSESQKAIGKFNSKDGGKTIETTAFDIVQGYRDRVNQRALITIAGNKISRNAAKSPVMVFIYGSSIGTIKKAIANIVGKEALYNTFIEKKKNDNNIFYDVNKANTFDLSNKDYALKLLLSEMSPNGDALNDKFYRGNEFKKINNEESIVENMTSEEKENAIKNGDLSGMIINEDMMAVIQRASAETYGKSFELTFKNLFNTVSKSREIIKINEVARYSIYKSKINKAFAELAKEKGLDVSKPTVQFELTKNDVLDIKKKLERDGFGHSNLDANGARQSLDKMTAGIVGKVVTINFKEKAKENEKSKDGYASFSGSFKTDTENTGAAPVTGIHQLDGRKIGLALEGTGTLNIYDAFYSSTNKLDSTSDKMNEEFLNTVESYNLVRTSLKEVENMILALEPDERTAIFEEITNSPLEYKIIEEAMKKIDSGYDIFRVNKKGAYTFSTYSTSMQLSMVFEDINAGLSNPTEVLVRHNQLSDSAKGHTGVAFNHDFEDIDAGLVFAFFSDVVSAAREAKNNVDRRNNVRVEALDENSTDNTSDYIRSGIVDESNKELFTVVRNEESYKQNTSKITSMINSLGLGGKLNDESKKRFEKIIEDFKKCIG